ncbi:DsbA family protein [Undibacterium terreum]|uniref:DsbA family protein n=1 Tax=Undibacterium terreum TaxID=1224302 RepID=A0A916XL22_9BURK|nr:DsbA family protein [Undibacterium terreum]GGC79844.1 DsbA family protein [Undibacterium terreum]
MTQLLYIADPMCSWCYGFGPELDAFLAAVPDVAMDIITGGLRAYNTEVMDEEKKATILGHWQHVAEASGLPFSNAGMSQPGFIYDTEPACRAVVAARTVADELSPRAKLAVFRAIQHAFYAEGKDVTKDDVLSEVCVNSLNAVDGGGYDIHSFMETMTAHATAAETREEFEQTQRWGIRGFPALLVVHEGALHMLASGYTKTANLLASLQQVQQS